MRGDYLRLNKRRQRGLLHCLFSPLLLSPDTELADKMRIEEAWSLTCKSWTNEQKP